MREGDASFLGIQLVLTYCSEIGKANHNPSHTAIRANMKTELFVCRQDQIVVRHVQERRQEVHDETWKSCHPPVRRLVKYANFDHLLTMQD